MLKGRIETTMQARREPPKWEINSCLPMIDESSQFETGPRKNMGLSVPVSVQRQNRRLAETVFSL